MEVKISSTSYKIKITVKKKIKQQPQNSIGSQKPEKDGRGSALVFKPHPALLWTQSGEDVA